MIHRTYETELTCQFVVVSAGSGVGSALVRIIVSYLKDSAEAWVRITTKSQQLLNDRITCKHTQEVWYTMYIVCYHGNY